MKAMSIATIFSALSGFIVIFVATLALDGQVFEQFNAYWGLFFAVAGLIDGLMQETTRAVSSPLITKGKKAVRPSASRRWTTLSRGAFVTRARAMPPAAAAPRR